MIRPPINWSDQPSSREPMLKILHAPVDGRLELVVLCERDFGVFVHWDHKLRRNQPCTDPYGCICQVGPVPTSWRTYLGVQLVRGGKIALAELSSPAWTTCKGVKWIEHRGTLRGARLTLERYPHTKEGQIIAHLYEPVVEDLTYLPPAPNVKDELTRIWFSRL